MEGRGLRRRAPGFERESVWHRGCQLPGQQALTSRRSTVLPTPSSKPATGSGCEHQNAELQDRPDRGRRVREETGWIGPEDAGPLGSRLCRTCSPFLRGQTPSRRPAPQIDRSRQGVGTGQDPDAGGAHGRVRRTRRGPRQRLPCGTRGSPGGRPRCRNRPHARSRRAGGGLCRHRLGRRHTGTGRGRRRFRARLADCPIAQLPNCPDTRESYRITTSPPASSDSFRTRSRSPSQWPATPPAASRSGAGGSTSDRDRRASRPAR